MLKYYCKQKNLQLVIWTIFFLACCLYAQGEDIRFRHLSIEEGLSQSYAICIVQDDNGFIWIGTETGLNKYDGYTFKVYESDADNPHSLSNGYILSMCKGRDNILWIGTQSGFNRYDPEKDRFTRYLNNPNDSNSLSNNWVYSICEDRSGEIWIGTNGGLNRFNQKKNRFVCYKTDPDNPHSISSNKIRSVYQDTYGVVWIGTEKGGLNKFDRKKEQFVWYKHIPDDPTSLSNNTVLSICEDHLGNLWIGTYGGGLNKFDRKREQFFSYRNIPGNPTSLSDDYINVLYEDKSGDLWIGTENGGVNVFNRQKEQFLSYQKNPADPHSLNHNRVLSIYEDNYNGLWIGTRGGGISLFYREAHKFKHYRTYPNNPNSLNDNMIWQIYEDNNGIIWIGTGNGGLNKFDRKRNTFTHYMHNPDDPNSISYNRVIAVCEDKSGVFWIGTYGGLNKFNRETEQFIHYKHDPNNPSSLSYDKILGIYEDRSGVLWIGTKGGGLNKFNRETEQFIHYKHDPNNPYSLSHNRAYPVYEDRSGVLWIGTNGGGLNKFDREKEQFIHYKSDPNNPNSISDNSIFSIYEDRSGVLWIGTFGQGLNRFYREKNIFVHFTKKDGLPDNTIYNILEDDNGNLWMSTNNGISMFNPKTGEFKNYDVNDGLQSNEFNSIASCKSKSGEMFFGGINGFNAFFPDSIKDNTHVPRVVITDFKISNKSVPIGKMSDERTILEKSITETDEILLSYRDNVFSFEFVALHYISPDKNQYAYIMEGIEKDWNYVGNRRYVTYSGLPPGEYLFRVKGSNNDGLWNEEGTSLTITIIPPFWKTWWFYTLCMIIIIASATVAYTNHVNRVKRHEEEEERRRVIADFNQVLEQGSAAVYRRDFDSNIYEFMGECIKDITGYNAEEITVATWDEIVLKIEMGGELSGLSIDDIFDRVRKGELDRWVSDFQLRTKSGEIRWVRDMTSALRDKSGQCYACLGIMFDITDRKLAEQELAQTSEELSMKNKDMETDLNMAREVQTAVLSKQFQHFPIDVTEDQCALQFFHRYHPASSLAGDFFDILPISDHEVGVLICDVMGHGARASLLTFFLRGLIEELMPIASDPCTFIRKLNSGLNSIMTRFYSGIFATAFYCVADIKSGRLRYTNAGHPIPFLLSKSRGIVETLKCNGGDRPEPAIGIHEDYTFSINEYPISNGDIVFFFTDGLYEVAGSDGSIFGKRRLFETVKNMLSISPTKLMDDILQEINQFAASKELADDVCIVTMHVRQTAV